MSYNNKRGGYYPSRHYANGSGGGGGSNGQNNGESAPSGSRDMSANGGARDAYGGDGYEGEYANSYNGYYDSYRGSYASSNSKYRKYNKYNNTQSNSIGYQGQPSTSRNNSYYGSNFNSNRRNDRYDSYPGKQYSGNNYEDYEDYNYTNNQASEDYVDTTKKSDSNSLVSSLGFRDERRGPSISGTNHEFKDDRRSQPGYKNNLITERKNSHPSYYDKKSHHEQYNKSYEGKNPSDQFSNPYDQYNSEQGKKPTDQYHFDKGKRPYNSKFDKTKKGHGVFNKYGNDNSEGKILNGGAENNEDVGNNNTNHIDSTTLNDVSKPSSFEHTNNLQSSKPAEHANYNNPVNDEQLEIEKEFQLLAEAKRKADQEKEAENIRLKKNQEEKARKIKAQQLEKASETQSLELTKSKSMDDKQISKDAGSRLNSLTSDKLKPRSVSFDKNAKPVSASDLDSASKLEGKSNVANIFNDDVEAVSLSKKVGVDHSSLKGLKKSEGLDGNRKSSETSSSMENDKKRSESSNSSTLSSTGADVQFTFDLKLQKKKNHANKLDLVAQSKQNSENDLQQDDDLSEAETVVTESPPRLGKIKKLIRKKDFDVNRHNVKKKRVIPSSEEENDDVDIEEGEDDNNGEDENIRREVKVKPRVIKKIKAYKIKRDSSGRTMLQRACEKGNINLIKDYLANGASANEKDFGGFTCLHEAALAGNADVVQLLIDHGADVNAKSEPVVGSETPLIDAAENKHFKTVKILLDNGADPTIYNSGGFTALTKILNSNDQGFDDIKSLLDEALEKFQRNTIKDDPIDLYFGELIKKEKIYKSAAEGIQNDTIQPFLEGLRIQSKPDVLFLAARNGHKDIVSVVLGLDSDFEIDTENGCGVTVLLSSVGRGHRDVVELLLDKGADPLRKRNLDNLNSIEIAQRSVHYDESEIDLLRSYAEKKSGYFKSLTLPKNRPPPKSEDDKNLKTKNLAIKKRKSSESEPADHKRQKSLQSVQRSKSPDAITNQQQSEGDQVVRGESPKVEKIKQHVTKHSASPSPAPVVQIPLTKAQEEQKAKSAELARQYQEKSEAAKLLKKQKFLDEAKERERLRLEEEQRRVEENKRKEEELIEQEKKSIEERKQKAIEIEKTRKKLRYKLGTDHIPIGLRHYNWDKQRTTDQLKELLPLYRFEKDGTMYVIDLQIAMIASKRLGKFGYDVTGLIELTSLEKSKVWGLFFPFIGRDRKRPHLKINERFHEGHELFQNLSLHFIKHDECMKWLSTEYPIHYKFIMDNSFHNEVLIEMMTPYKGPRAKQEKVLDDDDVVIDYEELQKKRFIPPRVLRNKAMMKDLQRLTTPLW